MGVNLEEVILKSSRYYQNFLQVVARFSSLALYLSGFFFTTKNFRISILVLILSLLSGYLTSDLKYRRSKAIANEKQNGFSKKLKKAKFYQNVVQITGRGRDVIAFFSGVLLGAGHPWYSTLLLLTQLVFGFSTTEALYYREQSIYNNDKK